MTPMGVSESWPHGDFGSFAVGLGDAAGAHQPSQRSPRALGPPRPPDGPGHRSREERRRGEEGAAAGAPRPCRPASPPPRPPPRPWRRRRALLPPEAEGLFGFLFFILLSFVFLHKNQQL